MGDNSSFVKYFIGPFIKVFLAWTSDPRIRWGAASGGVGTAILMYMLKEGLVEAVIVPKLRVRKGLVYGVWTIVEDPNELCRFSGSIYAPTYGFAKVLRYAKDKFMRIAVTALPCHTRVVRALMKSLRSEDDVFIVGLYCNNTPAIYAFRYITKLFRLNPNDIEFVKFRGNGWPGYMLIKSEKAEADIWIPFSNYWDSGFGQYFYGLGCYLCNDHTNISADISLADPWTLPHEPIRRLGGATLVVVRSRKGLDVFESAVRTGYIKAVEIDPVYAIQSATIYRLTKKVLVRSSQDYLLPPSFSSISQELIYHIGRVLASREKLWTLLILFHKTLARIIMFVASFLDYRLGTRWAHINRSIELLQKARSENGARLLKELFKEDLEG
jgi:coenzyme F420 hydrogenase subunit beta